MRKIIVNFGKEELPIEYFRNFMEKQNAQTIIRTKSKYQARSQIWYFNEVAVYYKGYWNGGRIEIIGAEKELLGVEKILMSEITTKIKKEEKEFRASCGWPS